MLSALLAQASDLPQPTSYAAMGWIIAGVFGIVGLANQGMALWDRLFPRATPPPHELYATKAELAATRAHIEEEAEKAKREHKESDARIEARFESWMTQQQEQHEDSMRKFDEAMERFTGWQLTMERALGVIGTKADIALEKKSK
jgi:hypothetical protein